MQAYQPATGNDSVFAYNFQGGGTEVTTIVNTSKRIPAAYRSKLRMLQAPGRTSFKGRLFSTDDGALPLKIAPETLRVLVRV